MKQKLVFFFILLIINLSSAQTFNVDGINYSVITNTTTVKVTSSTSYVGSAIIPSNVSNGISTYTVTSIESSAFMNCTGLTAIGIPSTVTSFETNAFYGCTNLASINIPSSVTSLGTQVFCNCTSLTAVTIPNSVTVLGNATFANCSNLTSVSIGNSVTSIVSNMFSGCTHLTSVTIPNSITSIGNGAFNSCSSLTSISLPDSVTSIGNNTFGSCSGLTSFTLPNSITSIADSAFVFCSSLSSFYCNVTTPIAINANVFAGVNQSNCTLYVPPGSVTSYQNADVWKNFSPINPLLNNHSFDMVNKINCYPNPIQNELYVDLDNIPQASLQIIDTHGRIIQNQPLESINKINTSNLISGMYFVRISNNDGVTIRKMIKN